MRNLIVSICLIALLSALTMCAGTAPENRIYNEGRALHSDGMRKLGKGKDARKEGRLWDAIQAFREAEKLFLSAGSKLFKSIEVHRERIDAPHGDPYESWEPSTRVAMNTAYNDHSRAKILRLQTEAQLHQKEGNKDALLKSLKELRTTIAGLSSFDVLEGDRDKILMKIDRAISTLESAPKP